MIVAYANDLLMPSGRKIGCVSQKRPYKNVRSWNNRGENFGEFVKLF
jgi:hypothetical protein